MFTFITGSIRNKLLLAVSGACLLVAIALGIALTSLASISNSFYDFIEEDQARLQAFSNIYAQGLQGGQALRNIVLSPSTDKKGYSNLEKSYKDFDDAFLIATRLTQSDPTWRTITAEINEKWKGTVAARQRVLESVSSSQTEAVKRLNEQETPAWRLTRELLLKSIGDLEKATHTTKTRITDKAQTSLVISVIIGVIALLFGARELK